MRIVSPFSLKGLCIMAVYLAGVRMTGCQSFDDAYIPLADDKVNVFVAENNTGKSVFFKMLQISVCPGLFDAEDRRNLIRNGKEFAQIIFKFSDGSFSATRVYRNNVIFYYTESQENGFRASEKPFKETLEKLSVLIDESVNYVANIIESEQDLMLVTSSSKSNSSLMKMFTESVSLKDLGVIVKQKLEAYQGREESITDKLRYVDAQLKNYDYVDLEYYEKTTEYLERLYEVSYNLFSILGSIRIIGEIVTNKVNYDFLLKISNNLETISCIRSDTCRITIPMAVNEELADVLECMERVELVKDLVSHIRCTKQKDFSKLTTVLDIIAGINLVQGKLCEIPIIKEQKDLSSVAGLVKILTELAADVNNLSSQRRNILSVVENNSKLIDELNSNGEIISCPVYGDVIFGGSDEKCIPIDNRHA